MWPRSLSGPSSAPAPGCPHSPYNTIQCRGHLHGVVNAAEAHAQGTAIRAQHAFPVDAAADIVSTVLPLLLTRTCGTMHVSCAHRRTWLPVYLGKSDNLKQRFQGYLHCDDSFGTRAALFRYM
jgi:hypothetical protein